MTELTELTLCRAAELLRAGALSAVDYTEAHLDAIAQRDGRLNAFLTVLSETARAEARKADAQTGSGAERGPLHGITIAVKDIIDVAGTVTTCHSAVQVAPVAQQDAQVIRRLRAAGAIILGKTALSEFAAGGPAFDLPWPPARNPWNTNHQPGGSSSGSAVAVAARMAPAALGTDTAGSVRHPAACCGVVGLKPTYDAVSRHGVFPLAFSLDHVGVLARNVADTALLHDVLCGPNAGDAARAGVPRDHQAALAAPDLGGLRIGVLDEFGHDADAEIQEAFQGALRLAEQLGAELVPLRLPPLEAFAGCGRLLLQAEAYAVHKDWLATRAQDYGKRARLRLLAGRSIDAASYINAQRLRRELTDAFRAAMAGIDAALCVSSHSQPACFDQELGLDHSYERQARTPFNVTGSPALSIPMGMSSNGLPIGIQIVGHHHDEATILRVGNALEQASSRRDLRPPLES